jgi:hypothetical protein
LPESALSPIADESLHRSEMTRCANRTHALQQTAALFNHLVGATE